MRLGGADWPCLSDPVENVAVRTHRRPLDSRLLQKPGSHMAKAELSNPADEIVPRPSGLLFPFLHHLDGFTIMNPATPILMS